MRKTLTTEEYQSLAHFRQSLRRYLRFGEKAAHNANLKPHEDQLLLTIKGLTPNLRPRIAELADRLQIQHHSAIELVNRLEKKSLVRRERGTNDRREVLIKLTIAGERIVAELVALHFREIFFIGPELLKSLNRVLERDG